MSRLVKDLEKAARIAVRDCLNIQKGERVVVVTDEPCREIARAIWHVTKSITDPVLIEMKPRRIHGEEPPTLVAEVMKSCDVFIIPASRSLTHTRARREANKYGARGATMPGITVDVMLRALKADYKWIARLTKKLCKLLASTEKVIIKSDLGTELELNIKGRTGVPDTGIVNQPGGFSNLPAGEAYIAPVENKSNGVVVVDGSFAPIGFIEKPITLEIKNGRITRLKGNKNIEDIFSGYGNKERTLCELGIGTNPKAKVTGNVLEDEKVLGTAHVAFGNNLAFKGKNKAQIHLDAVMKKPSVWFDNTLIIKKGNILI